MGATVSLMDALDTFGRPLRDLRISVTDRCNFRCVYCMPKEVFGRDHKFLERRELLSFEEITRVARIFVAAGGKKIRITGGGPPGARAPDRPARRARRRSDADDERLAPAEAGAGARRRRSAAHHRQPRFAR